MIKEIPVDEFTAENWTRLAQTAEARCKWPRPFNAEHFFPEVRKLMGIGMAKAWSNDGGDAFLVALFNNSIFTGDPVGMALFWVSSGRDNKAGLELLGKFEAEAEQRGCVATYASAFRKFRAAGMTRLFRRLGYEPHEVGFIKLK